MTTLALLEAMNTQWRKLQSELDVLQARVEQISTRDRAEVAHSVPVYATTGDLPTAGQLGRLAAVNAEYPVPRPEPGVPSAARPLGLEAIRAVTYRR